MLMPVPRTQLRFWVNIARLSGWNARLFFHMARRGCLYQDYRVVDLA